MNIENLSLTKEMYKYENYESILWTKRYNVALELFKNLPRGKVLEVGCVDGKFLNKLKQLGFSVFGFDICPKWVELCKKKGLNVRLGDANQRLPYKNNSFDYVINFETIAHLIDPLQFAKEVNRILVRGGKFFIESVNSAYWKYRVSYLFAQTKNYELFWPGCESYSTHYNLIWPEHKGIHLQHYSLCSCKEMLTDIGFDVVDISGKISGNKYIKTFVVLFPNLFFAEYMFICTKR